MRRGILRLMTPGMMNTGGTSGPVDMGRARDRENKWYSQLWFKPETRDERVKEYVPEVLEESMEEQRTLMASQTLRDELVEHGHKVLQAIENKAPTPSIAPSMNHIMKCFGGEHLISQRALSYLIYPTTGSAAAAFRQGQGGGALPELMTAFADNFREMVDAIERDGTYVNTLFDKQLKAAEEAAKKQKQLEAGEKKTGEAEKEVEGAATEGQDAATPEPSAEGTSAEAEAQEDEPADVTMLVKCVSAMSLANLHCNDLESAVKCCDTALKHVVDPTRKGGVLALKAGLLLREKEYEQAAHAALLAVESSNNIQGYLHGAAALRFLKRNQDALELLESGMESHPHSQQIIAQVETLKKDSKPALEESPAAERTEKKEALEE